MLRIYWPKQFNIELSLLKNGKTVENLFDMVVIGGTIWDLFSQLDSWIWESGDQGRDQGLN